MQKQEIKEFVKLILPHGVVKKLESKSLIQEYTPPKLYNDKNQEVFVFYLQDNRCAHTPYSFVSGRVPSRIIWDRFNTGLPIQFYSHLNIINQKGQVRNETKRFGILIESEGICPYEYNFIISKYDIIQDLDALFTHSERLLNIFPNAKYIPGGGVWYGTSRHGGKIDDSAFFLKSKNVSIVSSQKAACELHRFRLELAKTMLKEGIGDVMGTVVNKYVKIADSLTDYRYSVAIENFSSAYYFTEKLMNCFASMTVPIYYGAKKIDRFFNIDGIIVIEEPTIDCVLKALRNCSESDYLSRKEAIFDNYQRVKKFLSLEDYIWENYHDEFVL